MIIENPHEEKVILGKAIFILLLHVNCTLPVALTQRLLATLDMQVQLKKRLKILFTSPRACSPFFQKSHHISEVGL